MVKWKILQVLGLEYEYDLAKHRQKYHNCKLFSDVASDLVIMKVDGRHLFMIYFQSIYTW